MADPKFLVDGMLGKLARWLIVLGYDARFASAKGAPDSELLEIAKKESRIFLTRDANIPETAGVRKLVLSKADFQDQLIQVVRAMRLKPSLARLFQRCTYCNRELEQLAREEALAQVPEKVRELDTPFYRCSSCRRLYWSGSHTERTIAKLKAMKILLCLLVLAAALPLIAASPKPPALVGPLTSCLKPAPKTEARDGYFDYKLDEAGRIWTRWNPVMPEAPVELPVTEAKAAGELGRRLANVPGPYAFAYDAARETVVAAPKPGNGKIGYVMKAGRLVEELLETAAAWHLHESQGGPRLPPSVRITEIQAAGGIMAGRGSDGFLYLYKPTVPDKQLPAKWEKSSGTPFGGALRFPEMRDWAFGLSIGVKPSERPTFEVMNPFTDIDNFYSGADGSKVFYGFTATLGVLTPDGTQVRYWDTGLPSDFSRGFLTPKRGQVIGERLAQAGSAWLLLGRDKGVPGLWLKAFDHEMLGSCPGLRYTYDRRAVRDKDKIQDLAQAKRFVPLLPWRSVPLPALSGAALVTDRIGIRTTGQGDAARELSIEGRDAAGAIGVYRRSLSERDWTFRPSGADRLLGRPVPVAAQADASAPGPVSRDFPQGRWKGFAGAPIKSVRLLNFHPLQTLDEESTLRFTLESGDVVDVLLRTSDGYLPFKTDSKDDAAINRGVGEAKVLTGTLEIPRGLEKDLWPAGRRFVRDYLRPFHHIPNLFVLTADLDRIEVFTPGRYRRSAGRFDYARIPKVSMTFARDASGESDYEIRAAAGTITRGGLLREALGRSARHLRLLGQVLFMHGLTKLVFFALDVFGASGRKHMEVISDLVPRLMRAHLRAFKLRFPTSYRRALNVLKAK